MPCLFPSPWMWARPSENTLKVMECHFWDQVLKKIVTTLSFSLRTLWRKLPHCEHPYGEIHVTRNKHLVPRTSWKWSLPGSRSELRSRSSLTGASNIWRPGWCFDSSFRKDLGSEDPAEPHQSPTHTLWDNKRCCFKPVSFEVYRTVYSLHRSR